MTLFRKSPASRDRSAAALASPLSRKGQLIELLVFLFLIVPSMAVSLFVVNQQPRQTGFVLVAVMIMLRDLSLVALIFYFLWRNGEPVREVGWRWENFVRELALGLLLFVPFFFLTMGIEYAFLQLGLSQPRRGAEAFLTPHGWEQTAVAIVLVVVVAITEETIFRGYLLLRLAPVSRNIVVAVILSSLIFSIGHGYEGGAGLATAGVMGTVFAVIYLWRGSLVAPMTMHFLQDFLVVVVLSGFVAEPAKPSPSKSPAGSAQSVSGRGPDVPAKVVKWTWHSPPTTTSEFRRPARCPVGVAGDPTFSRAPQRRQQDLPASRYFRWSLCST